MRSILTTALEVLGMTCVSSGVALYSPAAGLVTAGGFLLAIGVMNGEGK